MYGRIQCANIQNFCDMQELLLKKDGATLAVTSAVLQVFKGCSTVVQRINPLNNR